MSRIASGLLCFLLACGGAAHSETSSFEAADLVSTPDDPSYPIRSIAVGTVVLEITVDEKGTVENVRPIREIQSLTDATVESVRKWRFKPALLDGKPTRSRTAAAVTFSPMGALAQNVPLPPLSATERSARPALEPSPVDVKAASFPQYPVNTVVTGTVVLRVTVGSDGQVENTVAVHDTVPLTGACIRALKDWKFEPAQFQGRFINSSIALAFVLRPARTGN